MQVDSEHRNALPTCVSIFGKAKSFVRPCQGRTAQPCSPAPCSRSMGFIRKQRKGAGKILMAFEPARRRVHAPENVRRSLSTSRQHFCLDGIECRWKRLILQRYILRSPWPVASLQTVNGSHEADGRQQGWLLAQLTLGGVRLENRECAIGDLGEIGYTFDGRDVWSRADRKMAPRRGCNNRLISTERPSP